MNGVLSFLSGVELNGAGDPLAVSAANPLPVTLSGGIGGLSVAGTIANGAIGDPFPVVGGGRDITTGEVQTFQVDPVTGGLLVYSAGGAGTSVGTIANGAAGNPAPLIGGGRDGGGILRTLQTDTSGNQFVVGNVANNAADSGNPVKIGGIYSAVGTLGLLTVGTRGDVQLDPQGNIRAAIVAPSSTGNDAQANNIGKVRTDTSNASASTYLGVYPLTYNGATWDRTNKPRTAFRLPSSAATNNASNIKTTPGTVLSISFDVTLAASTCYLKLFDTTGAPNPAAINPIYMFACNIVNGFTSINLPSGGLYFPTGIGVALVANPADLDNTAIAAGQVTALNIGFQ